MATTVTATNVSDLPDYWYDLDTNEDFLNVMKNMDYYNIDFRAKWILRQPNYFMALVLGGIGILANSVSILALTHVPQKLFSTISLACSDILVGLSVVAMTVHKVFNPIFFPGFGPAALRLRSTCGFLVIKAMNTTALTSTLLNLMSMAADHYVAILHPLHYGRILSKRRKNVLLVGLWVLSFLVGFSAMFSVFSEKNMPGSGYNNTHLFSYNICEVIWMSSYQEEYPLLAIALICLVLMLYIYIEIYREVQRCQNALPPYFTACNMPKSRKALITTLLILGTFILCWLPLSLFQIILLIKVHFFPDDLEDFHNVLHTADQYLYDMLLVNSICDPIIYAIRLREVRAWFTASCTNRTSNDENVRRDNPGTAEAGDGHHPVTGEACGRDLMEGSEYNRREEAELKLHREQDSCNKAQTRRLEVEDNLFASLESNDETTHIQMEISE